MEGDQTEIERMKANDHYIIELNIDPDSLPATSPEMQHERRVAIFDMLEENYFRPLDSESGPYVVRLSLRDTSKLLFDISRPIGEAQATISLSLIPFRRIIKDYFDMRELS